MEITMYGTAKRPWGYETLVNIIADDGAVYNECVVTDKYPADNAVESLAEERVLASIARKLEEEALAAFEGDPE